MLNSSSLDDPHRLYSFLSWTRWTLWAGAAALVVSSWPIWALLHPLRSWFDVCESQHPGVDIGGLAGGRPSLVPFGNVCTFWLPDGGLVETSWPLWQQAWGYLWVIAAIAWVALLAVRLKRATAR